MASATKNPVGDTLGWIATIGGVAGLVGMFFPITREVLAATGLWGWVAFATLLALLPWIVRFWANSQLEIKADALKKEWAAERLAHERDTKDLMLVREWLGEWELHGHFHVYLVENILFGHLPLWFVQQMEDHRYMWDRDPRNIEDPALRKEWARFRLAVEDFTDKVNEYMWLEDRTREEREAGDDQYMHIPPEWKTRDHIRYKTAVDELQASRQTMASCMGSLFETMYSYSPAVLGRRQARVRHQGN